MDAHVLIVDDDAALCRVLTDALGRHGFRASWRVSLDDALEFLETGDVDAVVGDLNLPGANGLDLCERLKERRPDVPFVVITAFASMESALRAVRAGAYDFIQKPVESEALAMILTRAVRHRSLEQEVRRLRRQVARSADYEELIGESRAMKEVYRLLSRFEDSNSTTLITGETGTGKELVARALHRRGPSGDGPFVAVNCAAISDALFESELFGHVQGAFTGADQTRPGLFREAHGGTLFLDEVGELPLRFQPKLLRALEARSVRPVGTAREVEIDVRVIAATNRDLEAAVASQALREDLFFRLDVLRIDLPPLRARGTDVLLLAQHFIDRSREDSGTRVLGLTPPAADKLLAYPWPGNVRELQNCIERAVALAQHDKLTVDDLPPAVREHRPSHVVVTSNDPGDLPSLAEVERRYVEHVLEAAGGNKAMAARILGVDRTTLYRKIGRSKSKA